MSSTPSDHPMVKLTVTVADGRVHPVVTSCIEPVATLRLSVWPASSASVSVPALVAYTRRLCRTRATRRGGAVEAHRGGNRGRHAPVTDEHVRTSVGVSGHEV